SLAPLPLRPACTSAGNPACWRGRSSQMGSAPRRSCWTRRLHRGLAPMRSSPEEEEKGVAAMEQIWRRVGDQIAQGERGVGVRHRCHAGCVVGDPHDRALREAHMAA
ncbi:unnamed protein product, partial [Urochloa humidicola]